MKIKQNKTGYTLFFCIIFLSLFGILMVYSASCYYAKRHYDNQYFFLIKQIIGFVIGLIALIFFSKFDYHRLEKFKYVVLIISYILLILVFIPGIGVSNYGATRWISLPGFTIQPSEIGKFAFILFASSYLSKNYKEIKKFKTILPIILSGGIMCLLIIIEPNMSITMCVGIVLVFMLLLGGISFKHFLMLLVPAIICVPVLIMIEPYRLKRLLAFVDPFANPKGEGYQLIQSFYSISSGGFFGTGLFNSRQKYLFLPFAESDFIFSIICEEFGFIGGAIMILLFFVVVFCGIKVASKAKDRFGCYMAGGITFVIAVQTLLNLAVVTGLIPPTGLPLPFISAGSTSLVVFMSAIGILLNINQKSNIDSGLPFKMKYKNKKLLKNKNI